MPLERLTLETSVDQQKAKAAVLQTLDQRSYTIEVEFDAKIIAKHAFSAGYYPHEIQILLESKPGKTIISASINHHSSQTYLKRLSEELVKVLPPLPSRIFNPMGNSTTQEEQGYQAKILNRDLDTGEQIIWSHIIEKGVLNKEVTERWLITNLRAIKHSPVTKENPQEKFVSIGWLDLSDCVVMNQFRKSKGYRVGSFAGTYRTGTFAGINTGFSSGISLSYGDILFLYNDKEAFRFTSISDPNDLSRVVKTLKKESLLKH